MAMILEKRSLTPVTKLFRVEAPLVAAAAKPGQFVIVRVREGGERIPLTIADYDHDDGTLTIVVQEVGTTTQLLGRLEVGDDILDLVGPLGMAIEIPTRGHIVGIGGGFGAKKTCLSSSMNLVRFATIWNFARTTARPDSTGSSPSGSRS